MVFKFFFFFFPKTVTGILMFGPPGTGKTLMARAVAASCGAAFLNVQISAIESMWVGESQRNIRGLFSLARKLSPCVIFVDEVDALLRSRSQASHWAQNNLNECTCFTPPFFSFDLDV
jgi:ATP-dependent 26S proteasome regulatory subunit